MSFTQGVQTINGLAVSQPVVNSIVPVTVTGFTRSLSPGTKIRWQVGGIFSTGATGGFRFLSHCTVAPTIYTASFSIINVTTPTPYLTAITAEAAFSNASAVATNYQLFAGGTIVAGAATVWSFQFAQENATADPIIMIAGLVVEIWQF